MSKLTSADLIRSGYAQNKKGIWEKICPKNDSKGARNDKLNPKGIGVSQATKSVKKGRPSLKPENIIELHNLKSIYTGFHEVPIKPLSVNRLFQGRRFRTKEYDRYEKELRTLLPVFDLPTPPYKLIIVFGMSNKNADLDNNCKGFIDILQVHYRFDDKHIYELHVFKEITKKGTEFIKFNLNTI